MHNNYERLFQELTELVDDSNVYESLDSNLKKRVDSIFFYNTKPSPDSTIK